MWIELDVIKTFIIEYDFVMSKCFENIHVECFNLPSDYNKQFGMLVLVRLIGQRHEEVLLGVPPCPSSRGQSST